MNNPIYETGRNVEVGHICYTKDQLSKEIIRVDTNTRQVWFKKGGFEWFEDMKKYRRVETCRI